MRQTMMVIALLAAGALGAGCGSKTEERTAADPEPAPPAAAQKLERAKAETKEAAQAVQELAYAQKAEFIARMRKELADLQVEIDRLADKVDQSSGEAKAQANSALDGVRVKSAEVKSRLDEAENATEATWNGVKGEFRKSYGELKESVDKTRQWLSDKIAP